ncbi:hypothetical protein TURU_071644 [Turdus rufiventris]|nr:hypothetical protein TURU_071644 [Turdus rufiventris]
MQGSTGTGRRCFRNGISRNGTFGNATFSTGTFSNGTFENDTFSSGTFGNGTFSNGTSSTAISSNASFCAEPTPALHPPEPQVLLCQGSEQEQPSPFKPGCLEISSACSKVRGRD